MDEFTATLAAFVCPHQWADSHMDGHSLSALMLAIGACHRPFLTHHSPSIRHAASGNEKVASKRRTAGDGGGGELSCMAASSTAEEEEAAAEAGPAALAGAAAGADRF
jgi:hypothetical protein